MSNPERSRDAALKFSEFSEKVAAELDMSFPVGVKPESRLIEDLSLDSLQMIELVGVICEVSESSLPPELVPSLETLGDSYNLYLQAYVD
jgi:acyl carrier protein